MVLKMRVARRQLAKMVRRFSCGMPKIEGVSYKMLKSFEAETVRSGGRKGEGLSCRADGPGSATPAPESLVPCAVQLINHFFFFSLDSINMHLGVKNST